MNFAASTSIESAAIDEERETFH
jgi:hypothetical protein